MINIAFFGTPQFAANILKVVVSNLPKNEYRVVVVVTQADKAVGREKSLTASPVAELANGLHIPVLKPLKLKDPLFMEAYTNTRPDLNLVVAYGKIIPQAVLDVPKFGSVNIHGSLLPKYRGASPIHAALLNGDQETGISLMVMDPLLDHGPVFSRQAVEINPNEKFDSLEKKLCDLAQVMLIRDLPKYINKELLPQEQEHRQASQTSIIQKEDGYIQWEKPARQIYNMFRAYYIWPGIWTKYNGQILKITDCQLCDYSEKNDAEPGTVFLKNSNVCVKCGDGYLQLLEIQLEGRKKTAITDFIHGYNKFIGSKLG